MKKTLIALAVVASAAVSGSAMADWGDHQNGNLELGGVIHLKSPDKIWEAEIGGTVSDLDVQLSKGDTKVDIPLQKVVPVLGIRTHTIDLFSGTKAIAPQIHYGPVDGPSALGEFKTGVAPLTLDVKDDSGDGVGTLTVDLTTGAEMVREDENKELTESSLYADSAGEAFFGGLGLDRDQVMGMPKKVFGDIYPAVIANFHDAGLTSYAENTTSKFDNENNNYSAFYASALQPGNIHIELNKAMEKDISWKAVLPVTISYQ